VKGTSIGELQVNDIMSDESVEAGEHVVTSGGDRIYPKGLAVGTVSSSVPDHDNDPFLVIKIKPATDLGRLEEVLVITEISEKAPPLTAGSTPIRAADILAQRLPSVPKLDESKMPGAVAAGTPSAHASPTSADKTKNPATAGADQKKEASTVAGTTKPTSAANTAANAATPKAGTNNTASGNPAGAAKQSSDTKKSATGQATATNAVANGAAAATPTPKPKTAQPKKPKAPANPDAGQPSATGTNSASQPEATPTPASSGEKPPQ
jgi:rod shape-determining protein MreC